MTNTFKQENTHKLDLMIMEFAMEYHVLKNDPTHCEKHYEKSIDEIISDLKNTFEGASHSTKAAIIKALSMLVIYDGFPMDEFEFFLDSMEDESFFIKKIIAKAKNIA